MGAKVPKWVYAPAGPVEVRVVKGLTDPDLGGRCFGLWDPEKRLIFLEAMLSDKSARQFLYHEQFHAWLDDLGVLLPNSTIERLCDGYALARMGEQEWTKK